jgi:hypothetical protein
MSGSMRGMWKRGACDGQQKAPNRSYEAANRNSFMTDSTAPHLYSTLTSLPLFSEARVQKMSVSNGGNRGPRLQWERLTKGIPQTGDTKTMAMM